MTNQKTASDIDDFDFDRIRRGVERGDPACVIEALCRFGGDRGYGVEPGETVPEVLKELGIDN